MSGEIEKLQKLLQEDPSNFQARRELSVLLANNGFNEEALANLRFLEQYFPNDADISYNIGIICEKLKNYEDARIAYEKAISVSPQDDFYYNLGEVLVNLGEWDKAIEVFNEVLKHDPNDGNCYFNIGVCYLNKEEINLATDNFQKAVNLNPQDLYAYFYLGNIYQRNGLTNFAIENYNKVLEISPDYSWAYYNLASIAYKNGNLEEAKEYLLKTIEFNNQDIEAYKMLTKISLKLNEVDEIISILTARLDKEGNGDLYYVLAQVYKHLGEEQNYVYNLKSALKNHLTLTYPKEFVNNEYEKITSKFGAGLEPPEELEEYNSSEEYDEESFDANEEDNDEDETEDEEYYDEDEDEEEYEDEEYIEEDKE